MALALDPELFPLLQRLATLAGSLDAVAVLRTADHLERLSDDHRHIVPTLVLPLEGVTRVITRRGAMDLLPGRALLIEPMVAHRHVPLRETAAYLHQGFMPGWSDVSVMVRRRWVTGTVPIEPSHGLFVDALGATPRRTRDLVRAALRQLVEGGIAPLREPHPAVWQMAYRIWWNDGLVQAGDVLRASRLPARTAHRLFTTYFGLTPKAEIARRRRLAARALRRAGVPDERIVVEAGCRDRRMLERCVR